MARRCRAGEADVLVALTRERGRNEELRRLVGARAEIVETPLTITRYRSVKEVEDEIRATDDYGSFRCLVVTSARADRYVAFATNALAERPLVLSVGRATTEMLGRSGLEVAHESRTGAADLAPLIREGPVLILGAVGGRDDLERALIDQRHSVLIGCYETLPAPLGDDEREQLRRADVVFIGAPSAWRLARRDVSQDTWVLVPGATTLEAVRGDHARVTVGWGEEFEDAWREVVSSA